MGIRSEKSSPRNSKEKETKKQPLARKVASNKSHEKRNTITDAIKASQSDTAIVNNQPTEHSQEEPQFLYYEDLGARIAERAYELYDQRGREPGHDLEDWVEAERQILMEQESEDPE